MPLSRVLAVVSGDPSDDGVVTQAAEMVRPTKGKLYILYVIKVARSLPVDAEVESEVIRGERVLQETERLAHLPRGDVEAEILQSREVGAAVVHETAVRDVDAVVVGTSYPTELGAFSLGQDIPYILENAPCLVLLWREPRPGTRPDSPRRNGRVSARIG
ncbi:MAG: universal stress protein [Dehalococcoidia bacterium]